MIRPRLISRIAIVLAVLAVLPGVAVAQTPNSATDNNTRARNLFRQGAAAMKDGKYAEARNALLEAWSLSHTYDVAAILGQAEIELKLYRDAAEHLDFALRNLAPRESAETLDKIKAGLQSARQKVAELRISVSEPNAIVLVDGQEVGRSPLARSIFVDVGPHKIEARLDADRVDTQNISAAAASAYPIDLTIPERKPSAPSSGLGVAPPPSQSNQTSSATPSLVPVAIGGGVAVVALGLGIGFRVASSSSHDRLVDLRSSLGSDGCNQGIADSSDCAELKDAADTTDFRRNFSTAAFVVGGAAAVGTAVYWFWPRTAGHAVRGQARALRLSGYADASGGAVWLGGEF